MSWHPERIDKEIGRELERFGRAGAMGDIVAVWPEAVGASIAQNAWPTRLARDGTLHVAARSSAWAFELGQLEASVRERLRERLGENVPPALRFVPGPLPERGAEGVTIRRRRVPEVAPELLAEGTRIASRIEDGALRSLVARAVAASLARRREGGDDRTLW